MIWLASYPRSGNSFFRIVLEEVYGIESSIYHHDPELVLDAAYASYPMVKTHLLPDQLEPSNPDIPAIYLVRDGRDSLVSMAHHRSDLVVPGSSFDDNLRWAIKAKRGYFGGWSRNVQAWLRRASIVIRFEDLIADPIGCIERIRPLIDLPEPALDRLPSFENLRSRGYTYGNGRHLQLTPEQRAQWRKHFFRRGQVGSWKTEMTAEMANLFWRKHGDAMRQLNYMEEAPPIYWWVRRSLRRRLRRR